MGPLRPLRLRRRPTHREDFAEAETAAAAFRERYYGNVAGLSAAELAEAIDERERIESIVTRAIYYAHLSFSTNMADPARGALVAKLGEKGAGLETQLLFFGLEWAAIDDDPAAQLLADPALDHWRHWLSAQRVFRPYLLTEPEEKIITEKAVSGVSAWTRLYDELLGAMRVDLTARPSPSRSRRRWRSSTRPTATSARGAAEAVTAALEPGLRTRTSIFNTILVDKSIDDRLRGYPTWISAAQPRERDDRRGRAGARRRRRRRATTCRSATTGSRRGCSGSTGSRTTTAWRPSPTTRPRRPGTRRARVVVDAYAQLLERGRRHRRAVLRRELDRRARAAATSGTARSARRTSPASTRTCS